MSVETYFSFLIILKFGLHIGVGNFIGQNWKNCNQYIIMHDLGKAVKIQGISSNACKERKNDQGKKRSFCLSHILRKLVYRVEWLLGAGRNLHSPVRKRRHLWKHVRKLPKEIWLLWLFFLVNCEVFSQLCRNENGTDFYRHWWT